MFVMTSLHLLGKQFETPSQFAFAFYADIFHKGIFIVSVFESVLGKQYRPSRHPFPTLLCAPM